MQQNALIIIEGQTVKVYFFQGILFIPCYLLGLHSNVAQFKMIRCSREGGD